MIVNYKLILLFFNEKKNYVCCLQLDYVNSSLTLLIEAKFITQTNESMCLSMKEICTLLVFNTLTVSPRGPGYPGRPAFPGKPYKMYKGI